MERKSSTLVPPENYFTKNELPERIKINSQRDKAVLSYDLCITPANLNTNSDIASVILRPFKLLVSTWTLASGIGSNLQPATEEEYLEGSKDPAEDCPSWSRQEESSMALSELTGTINDLR